MVLPITVKPLVQVGTSSGGQFIRWRRKQRAVQKAPFTLPAPYFLEVGSTEAGGDGFSVVGGPNSWADQIAGKYYNQTIVNRLASESYEKLRGKLYDSAGLGVDFVEYGQSVDMIAKTCGTLLKFSKEVRKLHFGDAANTLRMHFVPKGVDKRKSFGSNFLQFHFGWEPLIHDVYDAMEVLHNPVKHFGPCKAASVAEDSGNYLFDLGSVYNGGKWQTKYRYLQGARIKSIENANLHTLEQYGLVNPASLVWEVVPFSFVVDWFVNVGDVLRSYTDFAGLTLTDTYHTLFFQTMEAGRAWKKVEDNLPPYSPRLYRSNGLYASRVLGLTSPTLGVKRLKLPSLTRGLTASALLTQFLKNPPKVRKNKRFIPKNERWYLPK